MVWNLGSIQKFMTVQVLNGDGIRRISRQQNGNGTVPFAIHSLVQSIGERSFLNNAGLLAELEGSTEIRRKEGTSLVEEFIARMVFKCKTHEIQEMVDEFLGWMHPNEMTRGGI